MLVLDDVFIGGEQNIEFPTAELRHKSTAQGWGALLIERKTTIPITVLSLPNKIRMTSYDMKCLSYLKISFLTL